jgi:hypothetical protein
VQNFVAEAAWNMEICETPRRKPDDSIKKEFRKKGCVDKR